ncbi:acyl-CoA dehydrogenase [Thermodesulfobacteriota bacterium]
MGSMIIDERDMQFVLFEQLKINELCENEKFSEFSDEVFQMVLTEAQKFADNILYPLNIKGDKEGARYEDGVVYSTPGTKEAYQAFVEGGWLTPAEDESVGGQGLPHVILTATHEMFFCNFPFMCYVNLTHDAAKLIEIFGTEEQKKFYMEPMYAGQWTGTMALTEPGAGSDVGAIKVKAVPRSNGEYSIVGSKIYITNGENDVGENNVHLLLARPEGAPPGTRGLSIFLVPKYRINEDGSLGEQNDVTCVGIEHKMGLHASPTSSLTFGENGNCIGYLLGKEQEGIRIMFHMMNSSRLEVGIWGLTTCSMSYLHALNYAREREQGQSIVDPDPAKQVPIIKHPDIRRMLLMMKAYAEGMRAMLYYCGYAMDRQAIAENDEEKGKWARIVDFMIPICKAYPTEKGVELASLAVQVYGGYGYSSEYPVEQFMRDSKVACIFEGTTGIQAMDLAMRKLAMKKGKVFTDFMAGMDEVIEKAESMPDFEAYVRQFKKTRSALLEVPSYFSEKTTKGDFFYPLLKATPFLEIAGDVVAAWFLLWGAMLAREKLDGLYQEKGASEDPAKQVEILEENAEAAFLAGKIQSAKFFIGNILPATDGKIDAVQWGDVSAWEIHDRSFGA